MSAAATPQLSGSSSKKNNVFIDRSGLYCESQTSCSFISFGVPSVRNSGNLFMFHHESG